ncbi:MAG: SDR family oxidoreductase [Ignavibacteriales bacterium]|nr:SDR family oxidoreductase [Ignavibacteriales bacterium]MCF8315110.1 SDR family oxidoreductase [Ignavibacteriales bacterium]MCF8435894.1 SDR family oxidoreductase [Ignavibacteriales bacterium]
MNNFNPFSLVDKRILITGASSGIGKGIAEIFSAAGAELIITGRNSDRLKKTIASLNGDNHRLFTGDLTKIEVLEQLVSEIPPLHGVIHSAGIIELIPFKFITSEKLEEIMSINFTAPAILTNKLLKAKKLLPGASVVFISSITGNEVGTVGGSVYGASKGALKGMIKSLAIDLARSKVRVNNVAPGMIETEAIEELETTISKEALNEDMKNYPLGRYGNVSDVAYACQYLISDASIWVTGTTLVLDGGFTTK